MVFGNKKSFAVEVSLDENYGGEWLFGRFCYWVNGHMLGDYDLGVSLRDVFSQIQYLVKSCGKRNGGFYDLSSEEIFFRINDAIYGDNKYCIDMASRFEVSMPLDIFNRFKIFVVDFVGIGSKVIYEEDGLIKDFVIDLGLFDMVIKETYIFLDDLYEIEVLNKRGST